VPNEVVRRAVRANHPGRGATPEIAALFSMPLESLFPPRFKATLRPLLTNKRGKTIANLFNEALMQPGTWALFPTLKIAKRKDGD
jgi:hypothetical protein